MIDRDVLQRAHHLTDRLGGDPGIERGHIDLDTPSLRTAPRPTGDRRFSPLRESVPLLTQMMATSGRKCDVLPARHQEGAALSLSSNLSCDRLLRDPSGHCVQVVPASLIGAELRICRASSNQDVAAALHFGQAAERRCIPRHPRNDIAEHILDTHAASFCCEDALGPISLGSPLVFHSDGSVHGRDIFR
jgi:hypothetical protein